LTLHTLDLIDLVRILKAITAFRGRDGFCISTA